MAERRISGPLVLAAASAMIAVGLVVLWGMDAEEPTLEAASDPDSLHVDDDTPEAAAQSFYDAWRRRRWVTAAALSRGEARRAVAEKQASDRVLPNDERIIAERSWDALAHSPLGLTLDEVEMLGDDQFALSGIAEYQLVGRPYRRRVDFEVGGTPEGYRVSAMRLGDVLTELPEILRGGGAP